MPLNPTVTSFLDTLQHPRRAEIDALRHLVLSSSDALSENIKWNGPNYAVGDQDCVTLKINPPKKLQLIFHRGAKVKAQPPGRLIDDPAGLLEWKGHDRAVATFTTLTDIEKAAHLLPDLVARWIAAAAAE